MKKIFYVETPPKKICTGSSDAEPPAKGIYYQMLQTPELAV